MTKRPSIANFKAITGYLRHKLNDPEFNFAGAAARKTKMLQEMSVIDRRFKDDNSTPETLAEIKKDLKKLRSTYAKKKWYLIAIEGVRRGTSIDERYRIQRNLAKMYAAMVEVCDMKLAQMQRKKKAQKAIHIIGRHNEEQVVYESWMAYLGGKEAVVFTITRSQQTGKITSVLIDLNAFIKFGGAYMDKLLEMIANDFDPEKYAYVTGSTRKSTRNCIAINMVEEGHKFDLTRSNVKREIKLQIIESVVKKILGKDGFKTGDNLGHLNYMRSLGLKRYRDGSYRKTKKGEPGQEINQNTDTYRCIHEKDLEAYIRCKVTDPVRDHIRKTCKVEITKNPERQLQNQRIRGPLYINPQRRDQPDPENPEEVQQAPVQQQNLENNIVDPQNAPVYN